MTMRYRFDIKENLELYLYAMKWLLIAAFLSGAIGTLCAGFFHALDWASRERERFPWIFYTLPCIGALIGLLYRNFAEPFERSNLLVDEIHEPGRSAHTKVSLSLLGTFATHLGGGSAGWEGPVMQTGGSLGGVFARELGMLTAEDRRTAVMAGVAGGFGAVFGTPLAGMMFAVEVLAVERLRYKSLLPCFMASLLSDGVVRAWGADRPDYHFHGAPVVAGGSSPLLLLKVALAGVCFGLLGVFLSALLRGSHRLFRRIPQPLLRPVIGAGVLIALAWLFDTRDFLGLGASSANPRAVTILASIHGDQVPRSAWAGKALFTAVTFGSGFKGGEVTPLLYIGAAFGSMLSGLLSASPSLFAALGLVGVLAGATAAPLACTIMGFELFGSGHITLFAIACFAADLAGQSGIFPASSRTPGSLIGPPPPEDDQ